MHFQNNDERFIKVGITRNPKGNRFKEYEETYSTKLIKNFETNLLKAYLIEQYCLSVFKNAQYKPKNKFGGETECLLLEKLHEVQRTIEEEIGKTWQELETKTFLRHVCNKNDKLLG